MWLVGLIRIMNMGFYYSCKVVGDSITKNVCLCLLDFFTLCEQSTLIKNFNFLKKRAFLCNMPCLWGSHKAGGSLPEAVA